MVETILVKSTKKGVSNCQGAWNTALHLTKKPCSLQPSPTLPCRVESRFLLFTPWVSPHWAHTQLLPSLYLPGFPHLRVKKAEWTVCLHTAKITMPMPQKPFLLPPGLTTLSETQHAGMEVRDEKSGLDSNCNSSPRRKNASSRQIEMKNLCPGTHCFHSDASGQFIM